MDEEDPRGYCDESEDCPCVFVDGEGDVDVVGGWHDWIDCDPDPDRCRVLAGWRDDLAAALGERPEELLGDICSGAETIDDAVDALDCHARDEWHCRFVRGGEM